MKNKYLLAIGERTNSRSIYNLGIAISILMRPSENKWTSENGAYLEIIYDGDNPRKNVKIAYSFSEVGQEELYNKHCFEIECLMDSENEFLRLEFPQL